MAFTAAEPTTRTRAILDTHLQTRCRSFPVRVRNVHQSHWPASQHKCYVPPCCPPLLSGCCHHIVTPPRQMAPLIPRITLHGAPRHGAMWIPTTATSPMTPPRTLSTSVTCTIHTRAAARRTPSTPTTSPSNPSPPHQLRRWARHPSRRPFHLRHRTRQGHPHLRRSRPRHLHLRGGTHGSRPLRPCRRRQSRRPSRRVRRHRHRRHRLLRRCRHHLYRHRPLPRTTTSHGRMLACQPL